MEPRYDTFGNVMQYDAGTPGLLFDQVKCQNCKEIRAQAKGTSVFHELRIPKLC